MNDEHNVVSLPSIPAHAEEFRHAREMMEQFAQRFARHCRRSGIPAASIAFEFEEAGENAGSPRYAVATVNSDEHPEYEFTLEVRWRETEGGSREATADNVVYLGGDEAAKEAD